MGRTLVIGQYAIGDHSGIATCEKGLGIVFFEQKGLTHTALIAFDASTLTERLEQVTESFPSLYS